MLADRLELRDPLPSHFSFLRLGEPFDDILVELDGRLSDTLGQRLALRGIRSLVQLVKGHLLFFGLAEGPCQVTRFSPAGPDVLQQLDDSLLPLVELAGLCGEDAQVADDFL